VKELSSKLLGSVAAEGTQDAAAGVLGHARAARQGLQRFGDALGQALAKHAHVASADGEAAAAGATHAVQASADEAGPDKRPAHGRRAATTSLETDGASDPEASAGTEEAAAGERSRRAPARKRPATEERAAAAEGSPVAAGHAAASVPPVTPLMDATTHLAARAVAKGPLAAPSGAKPQPAADPVREKAREREAPKAEVTAPTAGAREQLTPPAAATEARPASRAAATEPAAAPLPAPAAGHELQGGVLRSAAHLTLDPGTAGSLELHLRVRDGALHLRVEGEGARAVEAHSGELSRALAGEGLKLAPVELGGADAGLRAGGEGGRGFEERRDAWQEAAEARQSPVATPVPASHSEAAPQVGRGIHVEA